MKREYRLVYFRGEWMVCSKARRADEDGRERLVWIYGPERGEFCLVGQEDYCWPLPFPEETNFFNDRFNFAIDTRFEWSDRWEKAAGADNMIALRACYEKLLQCQRSNTVVRMRHGARIIIEGVGTEELVNPHDLNPGPLAD